MLVLTRRINEAILLGDDVRITVLEIDGERIKLGIDAPHSLKILRAELLAEVRAFNREANQTSLSFMQSILTPEGVNPDDPDGQTPPDTP
ncbi:MAG: carbon storage regulator CsrA [Clostridia bacterium]|nr:carbon storage regulator CsrA [Clostridia bacterium]